jgi:hypothetical protein
LLSIENTNAVSTQDATTFSFRKSILKLTGKNFNSSNIQIRFRNNQFSVIFTNKTKFISSSLIEFESPPISEFNLSSTLRFPVQFQFGISFNNGNEYSETKITILDKYTDIYLYQVSPTLFPKESQTLVLQGLGFAYSRTCLFKIGSVIIHETNATILTSTSIQCSLKNESLVNLSTFTVFVTNIFSDISNGFDLTVYGNFNHFNFFRLSSNHPIIKILIIFHWRLLFGCLWKKFLPIYDILQIWNHFMQQTL